MNGTLTATEEVCTHPGPIPADALAALDRYAEAAREAHLRIAQAWILRLRIDRIHLVDDGAVSLAWISFLKRIVEGRLRPIPPADALDRIFSATIARVILDERRRQRAEKRGGSRAISLTLLEEEGFDCADRAAGRPEQRAIDEDELARVLEVLDREDESLRLILLMKLEDFTNGEIAAALGMAVWDVKRKLSRIRTILADGARDPTGRPACRRRDMVG